MVVNRIWLIGIAVVFLIVVVLGGFGLNNNGYRTVIQYPWGTTTVKFTPGVYVSFFGKTVAYPDVVTYDYEGNSPSGEGSLVDQGVVVRYQDGGKGTIYGKDRFRLPSDEKTMLELHRSFRSPEGLANRFLRPTIKEAHQLTAGLMSSEEAYAEKRGTYISWVQDQIANGRYVTELVEKFETNETGEKERKLIPVIAYDTSGQPKRASSALQKYGLTVETENITNWDFEPRTLEQIAKKREATMAIITAKAEAEKSKQDAITAEQKGKADVVKAQYEKEVIKAQAVVDAQREAEVAVIAAKQKVDVASQEKLEAEQKKLAAIEEKQRLIALGQGEAERKRLTMQADGYLQQKIDAWKEVNFRYASALEKQKWVPDIMLGGSQGSTGGGAQALIDMFAAQTAKQLKIDLTAGRAGNN